MENSESQPATSCVEAGVDFSFRAAFRESCGAGEPAPNYRTRQPFKTGRERTHSAQRAFRLLTPALSSFEEERERGSFL